MEHAFWVRSPIQFPCNNMEKVISKTAMALMDRMRRLDTIEAIQNFATAEARSARMPGWTNGPADAYRHLIVVGEMTRRFGDLPATLMAELNETTS